MLTVTEAAGAHLAAMIDRASEGAVVRIVFGFRGLEFQPSAPLPGDSEFTHRGRIVLVLDANLSQALKDKTLDVRHTEDGEELDLR